MAEPMLQEYKLKKQRQQEYQKQVRQTFTQECIREIKRNKNVGKVFFKKEFMYEVQIIYL